MIDKTHREVNKIVNIASSTLMLRLYFCPKFEECSLVWYDLDHPQALQSAHSCVTVKKTVWNPASVKSAWYQDQGHGELEEEQKHNLELCPHLSGSSSIEKAFAVRSLRDDLSLPLLTEEGRRLKGRL